MNLLPNINRESYNFYLIEKNKEENLINQFSLPSDIFIKILSYINDIKNIQSTSKVSKFWNKSFVQVIYHPEVFRLENYLKGLNKKSLTIPSYIRKKFKIDSTTSILTPLKVKLWGCELKKYILIKSKNLKNESLINLEKSSENKIQSKFFKNLFKFAELYREIKIDRTINQNRKAFYPWTLTQTLIQMDDNPNLEIAIDFKQSSRVQRSTFLSEVAWDLFMELGKVNKVKIHQISKFAETLKTDYERHNHERKSAIFRPYVLGSVPKV